MPDVGATDYVWMETKIVDVSRGLSHVYIYRRTCPLPGPSPRATRFEAVNPDLISINDRYLVNGNLYAIRTIYDCTENPRRSWGKMHIAYGWYS